MCGIAGVLHTDGRLASLQVLRAMTDAIAHRGPDGEGQWVEGPIGLGHRRLAVIDLSPAAHQPMMSSDERYVLTYNGEMYNYREIRAELETKGCRFRSQSDTEVVLAALTTWGLSAFSKFNGMFALALWDRTDMRLLLARDRYGVKPLYWKLQGKTLLFASEQKALFACPGVQRTINVDGLAEYLTFQNFFTNQTLTAGVNMLPAGSYAVIESLNPAPKLGISRYWDFDFRDPMDDVDAREYEEELLRLFTQAVNRQLTSDVEVGTYLSGGIDSGSIAAVAAQALPFIKSFTIGFDLSSASGIELAFDEREAAEAMSYAFKTEHYERVLKAGDMQRAMDAVVWAIEEPRVGQSYPNYYAAQLAGKFVRVVLSGAGGDELFGGYPWRYFLGDHAQDGRGYVDNYFDYWQRLLSPAELKGLIRADTLADVAFDARAAFAEALGPLPRRGAHLDDFVNASLRLEAKTFLHGLLVVEDKLSMAHGLESRVPFLDNDLVDFAQRCPVSLKVRSPGSSWRIDENEVGNKPARYFEETNDGKLILRRAMRRLLPERALEARKQGFSAPDATWFRGESVDFVRKRLCDPTSPLFDLLDFSFAQGLLNEHLDGKRNRRLLVWSLLSLDSWTTQMGRL